MEIQPIPGREIPAALEREFSGENIEAYADICLNVGIRLVDLTKPYFKERNPLKNRQAILLPSRGAVPIFMGAILALYEFSKDDLDVIRFLTCLDIPRFVAFEKLRAIKENLEKNFSFDKQYKIPLLLFPFTADVNFEKLEVKEDSKEEDDLIRNMRQFCTKAMLDFYKPEGKRNGVEFQRFLRFLEIVEGKKARVEFYRTFPQVKEIITIDTVISGKASNAIVPVFAESGRPYKAILVVDCNGQRLKPRFEGMFYKYAKDIDRYDMPRILTEDRGSALEGVAAVVYPQFIYESYKREQFVSAGDWYDLLRNRKQLYGNIFNKFLDLVNHVCGGRQDSFEDERMCFLRLLMDTGVLKNEAPEDYTYLVPPEIKDSIDSIQESSSHVVHIYVKNFKQLLNRVLSTDA